MKHIKRCFLNQTPPPPKKEKNYERRYQKTGKGLVIFKKQIKKLRKQTFSWRTQNPKQKGI